MPMITVEGEDVAVDCHDYETILDALRRHGYAQRFGCRRGGCAICKVTVVDGDYEYTRPIADKVLPENERDGSVCLTCRAVPLSDMTLRLNYEDAQRGSSLMSFYAKYLPGVTPPPTR